MLIRLYTANKGFLMIHTNIQARIENRIQLQFYYNPVKYEEKRYGSSLSPQRWTKISTKKVTFRSRAAIVKAVTMRRVFLFKLNTSLHDLKLFKLSLPGVNCQGLLI